MIQLKRNNSKLISKIYGLENIRKLYVVLLASLLIFLVVFMNYFYVSTLKDLEVLYAKYTKDRIIDIKKSFLKNSVDNMILSIQRIKANNIALYKNRSERASKVLAEYYEANENSFLKKAISYFEIEGTKEAFTVFIIDRTTNDILYENKSIYMKDIRNVDDHIKDLKKVTSIYKEESFGKYYIFYGVMDEYIKEIVTQSTRNRIYGDEFANDAYIWINEVVDYEGGDKYAIRLIHPNLKDTEGTYLSTYEQDIKGNYPYLEELNGVKKDGKIFFNYFFKKKTSNEIAEKITYARLYEEYDWIVAMGIYFDEIQPYIDDLALDGNQAISKMIVTVSMVSFALIVLGISLVLLLEHWYYFNSNKELKEKLNIDELTKAFNRRAAIRRLEEIFYLFRRHNREYAIILFDIDDFKKVNDTYGHDAGDMVLKNIVEIINKTTRGTDFLYRWGGEEFLLIYEGLKKDNIDTLLTKLLTNIENHQYQCEGQEFKVTVSMGASCFKKEDEDFSIAIKRADIALYESKGKGKNRATINMDKEMVYLSIN